MESKLPKTEKFKTNKRENALKDYENEMIEYTNNIPK